MALHLQINASSKKPKLDDKDEKVKSGVSVVCRIRPVVTDTPINYKLLPPINPNKIELFEEDDQSNSRCYSFTEIFD